MNATSRLVVPAAITVAALASAAVAAPPRYAYQSIDALSTPTGYHGAPARILSFDAAGNGYGYSLTGSAESPMVAIRWSHGVITRLPTPIGATSSHAAAANASGDIVGWYDAGNDVQGGALWRNGSLQTLGPGMMPMAVSRDGAVAGIVRNPAAPRLHAPAISRNGEVTILPMALDGAYGWVVGINDAGQVAGSWYAGSGNHRAVRWTGDEAEVLPLPHGMHRSEARAMNESGWIVGTAYAQDAAETAAVLWRDGIAVDLGDLDGSTRGSWAHSINNLDQIVGTASTSLGQTAFLWQDGTMHDLRSLIEGGPDDLDASFLVIGDSGHITGVRFLPDGTGEAFVLVPVPAPAGFALLAGLTLGLRRRAR